MSIDSLNQGNRSREYAKDRIFFALQEGKPVSGRQCKTKRYVHQKPKLTWPHNCGSVIDTRLGLDSLSVGVLDFVDFADSIGEFNDLRVGITTGEDKMHERGPAA